MAKRPFLQWVGGLGRYARKDLDDKKCVGFIFSIENQHIFLTTRKDLGWVGGVWKFLTV